jgi:hypothetical protein
MNERHFNSVVDIIILESKEVINTASGVWQYLDTWRVA